LAVEDILRAALEGRPAPRPLFGPLVSELAGDIEGIDRDQFVLDAGKMSKLLAELQSGAGLDVVWVATAARRLAGPTLEAATETAARLRQMLAGRALVGAAVAADDLPVVRRLLDSGVQLVLFHVSAQAAGLNPVRPLVAVIRFRRALPGIRLTAIDGEALASAGDPLPVVPLQASPAGRRFGITLTPDELDDRTSWPPGTALVTTWQAVDQDVGLARLSGWRRNC
jgi:hypothetical protein